MRLPGSSLFLGYGRLARRLILLFVAVSLVPLIASDWLATYATRDVNRGIQHRAELQRVRLVSRQVFDKLLNAKLLLGNFPADAVDDSKLPGMGVVFSSANFASEKSTRPLIEAWQAATSAAHPAQGFRVPAPASDLNAAIRIVQGPTQARVLLATLHGEAPYWVAEINPAYLWSPVIEASEDNPWRVSDASGTPLFSSAPGTTATLGSVQSQLFLGAEFDTQDWIFQSDVADPIVSWQGLPVVAWLALVATATLLIIALFSLWRIRKALAPLTTLTMSTRQIGQERTPLRIDVQRDDEIGDLAFAFNDMSARIASQFATLSDLAAIDQDILKGASIRTLAERAADQLASESPDAVVRIQWLEADGNLQDVTRNADVVVADKDGTNSNSAHISRFHNRTDLPETNKDVFTEERAGAVETSIPIVLDATTRAAIVWRSSQPLDKETLVASFNLRDRLAVAFAARDREKELVHLAMHDTLTGLASRYRLHQVLEGIASSPVDAPSGLLFIDLDHFKDVNDSRGHQAGDELLCCVADRLRTCCPEGAVLARQGGDEFALVLLGLGKNDACAIAEKILVEVKQPVVLQSGPCVVSASIGIAMFPTQAQSREGLLRCADVALYSAKAAGRNAYRVFDTALDIAEQTRVQLAADISGAAARAELELHYQARVRSHDLKIAGAEALVRWRHPQRGLIGPDDFIHIAEETGAIHEIGEWVIAAAAAQVAAWRGSLGALVRVAVNVSPKQFESGLLVEQVDRAVARHNIPHELLEIEVTESVLLGDTESVFAQMAQLRSRGVRIALDDFGTGYSSMALLASLPFDVMKIDSSFVAHLARNDRMRVVVRGIASIALSAKLTLVAEGIETAEQAAELTALGCHELQGFLFGRPVSADLFARGSLGRR
jgi:diguanylate cyclase (GGDEF)-like protein